MRAWILVALLLAGCNEAPADPEDDAFILFEATSTGAADRVQQLTCFDEGHVSITAKVTTGQLTARVLDGQDNLVYQRPMRGPDSFEREEDIGGYAGDWTLQLVMNDAFDGNYRVKLTC